MEVVLEQKDAGDWLYRGEGGANIVLAYSGSSPAFVGKVLRIQKAPRNGSPTHVSIIEGCHPALSKDECLLWKETADLVSAPTREIVKQRYVQHVISPLLGFKHVDAGIQILVSREFLESVEKNVLLQRPPWRVDAAKVNTLCNSGLLISDHSIFPHDNLKGEFCITVEIKPKCGFLPVSRFICEENAVKMSISRFRMHQSLKLHHKEISEISDYDPLDMFSGSKERIHKAINALFVTPQNNFRVFLNGTLIFGAFSGGADGVNCVTGEAFQDVLKCVITADDGLHRTNFPHLVTEAVIGSGLLDRLLKVQKLDVFDIEGVIHVYYDVISQPCKVCRHLADKKLSDRYNYLHSMSLEEKLRIVKDYLIAATAKDLSMMISFKLREHRDVESPYSSIFLEATNQTFDYKVSFIDLDMKPLKKMEHYYALDQRIVSFYAQMMKKGHPMGKPVSPEAFRPSNIVEDAYQNGNPSALDA